MTTGAEILNATVNTLKATTQQAKESLFETTGKVANTVATKTDEAVDTATVSAQQANASLTATTHKAVDAVTKVTSDSVKTITATAQQAKSSFGDTIEQTKGSFEQTFQTTGQLKNTASEAIQTAINSSINDWLTSHPTVFRIVQALIWATNHPILSLLIFLIAVAIAWSLVKAVGRLMEIAGLSLLKAPFMLGMVLIGVSSRTLGKFGGAVKRLGTTKTADPLVSQHLPYKLIHEDKQQRLAEISTRLEAIQNEQNDLLQEVATILASEKTNK